MLTADRLREVLSYNRDTGVFYRRGKALRPKPNAGGYLRLFVDGRLYYAHRLAWLYVTGQWPDPEIDHRDDDKANNRFSNLREATSSQNKFARRVRVGVSGVRGVRPHRSKWQAIISVNGKTVPLGSYATIAEAAEVRQQRALLLYGDFSEIRQ